MICLIHARKGNLANTVNANFAGIYHSINNDWLKCKRMRDWSWVSDDGIETTNFIPVHIMLSRIVIVYIFAEEQNLETSNRMSYSDVDMIYNGLQHLANFVNQQFLKLKHI